MLTMMQKIKIRLGSLLGDNIETWFHFFRLSSPKIYSPLDLKSYISRNVVVRKFSRNSKKIIVTMITADKEFGIKFLNDVIIQGDYVVKEHELTTAQARTNALTKQLVKSKNSIVSMHYLVF